MAYVDIDIEDYIYEISTEVLKLELKRRFDKGDKDAMEPIEDGVEPWSPQGLADDLRLVFYSRNASRFESLLSVLECHEGVAA